MSNYAEINAKPYGLPGMVNQLNLMVWGRNSWRRFGDAYSPVNWPAPISGSNAAPPVPTPNPWHDKQPYGYLFRIDVPASYPYAHLAVQIFDPDSYNRPDYPPAYATATACPASGTRGGASRGCCVCRRVVRSVIGVRVEDLHCQMSIWITCRHVYTE